MELLKLLSASQLVAQVVSFLFLLFMLRLLMWKPFLKLLDDRKERIASEYKRIEDIKAEVEKMKTGYEDMLNNIEQTAKAKIQAAIAEGKQLSDEIKERAKADGQKILDNAKDAIRGEVLKAKEDLRNDIVDITIKAAERVISEKLTEKEDKRLVEDFLKGMDKVK